MGDRHRQKIDNPSGKRDPASVGGSHRSAHGCVKVDPPMAAEPTKRRKRPHYWPVDGSVKAGTRRTDHQRGNHRNDRRRGGQCPHLHLRTPLPHNERYRLRVTYGRGDRALGFVPAGSEFSASIEIARQIASFPQNTVGSDRLALIDGSSGTPWPRGLRSSEPMDSRCWRQLATVQLVSGTGAEGAAHTCEYPG